MNVIYNKQKFVWLLILTLAILIILSSLLNILFYHFDFKFFAGLQAYFDFDGEANFPTFYSVSLIFMATIYIYRLYVKTAAGKGKSFLGFLSLCFIYIAVDEFTQLHEKLNDPINNFFNTDYYFSWLLILGGGLIAISFIAFSSFKKLSLDFKVIIIKFILIYLMGVVVVEVIGGLYIARAGNLLIYKQITIIEETFEIMAFIYLLKKIFVFNKKTSIINIEQVIK